MIDKSVEICVVVYDEILLKCDVCLILIKLGECFEDLFLLFVVIDVKKSKFCM